MTKRRRFEIALPLRDRQYLPVPIEAIIGVMDDVGEECRGYSFVRRMGFWDPPSGNGEPDEEGWTGPYVGQEFLVMTDAADTERRLTWFQAMAGRWSVSLNQRVLYMATYSVDWSWSTPRGLF